MKEVTYTPELADVYDSLLTVQQTMDLVLSDMHSYLNLPLDYPDELKADKRVLFNQLCEVTRCIHMLEEINPEECSPDLF